jgi:Spy/CpxP family protein refolding chaperone
VKRTFGWLLLLVALGGWSARAQEFPPPDPIEMNTFPPELVMQNQQAIGLSGEQREAIKREVREAQARFTELEWDLQNEMETFEALIRPDRVDEKKALAVLERVLTLERKIKETHLTLAIRIKNLLTPEQQARLREARHGWESPEVREMREQMERMERAEREGLR